MRYLTNDERKLVMESGRLNVSAPVIAERLGCSIRTVRRVRARYRETGSYARLPGSGTNKKTTAREDRRLRHIVCQERFGSLRHLTMVFSDFCDLRISQTTVRRRLHTLGFYSPVASRKPIIGFINRQRRVRWSTRTLPWTPDGHWARLIFSDESRFNLSYSDGRVRVWRTQGERYAPECLSEVQKRSSISVMVWGCIGYHGVGELVVLEENVTGRAYIETLRQNLLPSVENIFGDREHPFIFQHDNAPAHSARVTHDWLDNNDVQCIMWPAQSPDLNIIEHIWDYMSREVVRHRPTSRQALIHRLQLSWASIAADRLHCLYNSLPRRVRAVVHARGYPTIY